MKKDFIVRRSIIMGEGKPHVETYSEQELVRCKDCKHRDPEDKKCDCGHAIQWQLPRPDDWFCADGERINKCCGNCDIYDREDHECVYLQVKREEDSEACDNWEEHS